MILIVYGLFILDGLDWNYWIILNFSLLSLMKVNNFCCIVILSVMMVLELNEGNEVFFWIVDSNI